MNDLQFGEVWLNLVLLDDAEMMIYLSMWLLAL